MATKLISPNKLSKRAKNDGRLVANLMTIVAWTLLGCGLILCLFNLNDFNDRNLGLMVGIGFLVASFFIYTIGTNIYLVESPKRHGRKASFKK